MPALSTVLLSIKVEVRKAQLQLGTEDLTLDSLQKYFKKKDAPEWITSHSHQSTYYHVFGYKKGKKGTENKSFIPFLSPSITLFGDALVIASLSEEWKHPLPLIVSQWVQLSDKAESIPAKKQSKQEVSKKKKPTSQGKKKALLHKEGDAQGQDQDQEEEEEQEQEEEQEEEEEQEQEQEEEQEQEQEEEQEDDQDETDSEFGEDGEVDIPLLEEEEEREEPAPPVKRRRAPVCKVDLTALKDDIDMTSSADSHPHRANCLASFNFLEENFSSDAICSLERAIFEASCQYAKKMYVVLNWKSPQFVEIYKQSFRSVISNLHPKSPVKNPRLLHRVIGGEFELSAIPFMTPYEMYPEKWFELKDKLMQREQKILEGNKSRATDQFKCRRCGKRECTYYELQTRSADEPMTIFIMCLNCGKEWRQGG